MGDLKKRRELVGIALEVTNNASDSEDNELEGVGQ